MSYCDYCKNLPDEDINKIYHDQHYGFPLEDDNELFGRFMLEIMQAGLSWSTILKKEPSFRKAFDNYSISDIANYDEKKINLLLQNTGIIRNSLKIRSIIYNAQQILSLQIEFGSFKKWLFLQDVKYLEEWVKIFKKRFKFVGNEIVNEFLMSIGILEGSHVEQCPIYKKQKEAYRIWRNND